MLHNRATTIYNLWFWEAETGEKLRGMPERGGAGRTEPAIAGTGGLERTNRWNRFFRWDVEWGWRRRRWIHTRRMKNNSPSPSPSRSMENNIIIKEDTSRRETEGGLPNHRDG